jgi:hypothetical protein
MILESSLVLSDFVHVVESLLSNLQMNLYSVQYTCAMYVHCAMCMTIERSASWSESKNPIPFYCTLGNVAIYILKFSFLMLHQRGPQSTEWRG